MIITRDFVTLLTKRIDSSASERKGTPLIQVVLGPRQVGKTTGVLQIVEAHAPYSLYVSADETLSPNEDWLLQVWQKVKEKECRLLVIDEIQRVLNWSLIMKRLWDEEVRKKKQSKNIISLILLGSSSLDLHQGLTESLAGRFELITVTHWGLHESKKLIHEMSLNTYLKYGGYPGSYQFLDDPVRCNSYINNSILDAVVNKDILAYKHVKKPALFRQLMKILSGYPACEISYNKLLGQLQDKGNIDLVKYYLELLESAYLYKSLFKYSTKKLATKSSSPKIIPLCPALTLSSFEEIQKGRVFEAAVGADLLKVDGDLYYWREKNTEVDYVFLYEKTIYAIEVKSGRKKSENGLKIFKEHFPKAKTIIIDLKNYLNFSLDVISFLKKNS